MENIEKSSNFFEEVKTSCEIIPPKSNQIAKGKGKINNLRLKFIDDCFQQYIAYAMILLIIESGENSKNLKLFNRTAYYIARLVRPAHRDLYNKLNKLKSKELYQKFTKLKCSTLEKIYEEIYDEDFIEIFKILRTICKKLWYVPILNELTTAVDPTKYHFEIDLISHNIYKLRKK